MSIMTFEKYNEYLENSAIKLREIENMISYRTIQLVKRYALEFSCMVNTKLEYTQEEQNLLNNDQVLLSLKRQKEELSNLVGYVRKYGDFPLDKSETRRILNQTKED